MKALLTTAMFLFLPAALMAQVPVDDNGNVIGNYESQADIMPIGEDGIPRLSQTELQDLVGPIALYPDDLLAIVLPASAYPLQVVEAARFLEALETDPTLAPDPDWDDSIVALINYPEVVELLNNDLDWTWRLGEAVVAQQTDVIAAVESFRDRAYAAGNLKSDEYQTIANDDGVISISPAAEDVIYVPYYEPERVVYYQPRPAYYYHPQPYPVYYYPYAANHYFDRGFFWGVTTAFSIGWYTDSLHVYHHSYRGHPYHGRTYWNDGWYRRPSINVYNTTYVRNTNVTVNRYSNGDQWRARDNRREYVRREGYARAENRSPHRSVARDREYEPITFRERESRTVEARPASRNTELQHTANRARDTEGRDAVERSRGTRPEALTRTRDTHQRAEVERSPETRRQEPVVRTRDTRREPAADRTQRSTAYRPDTSRQTREQSPTQTPARTTVRTPAPREHRQSEARTQEQPSRTRESRSPEPRSRTSTSNKTERRSSDRRSQNEDRQH
jgi:hypothetical protein